MKGSSWKGQKAEPADEPLESGHEGEVAAGGLCSPELSRQDEKQADAVAAEREPAPADLEQSGPPGEPDEAPSVARDSAALEAAADAGREMRQDGELDDSPSDDGELADDDSEGEGIGWSIQLTRGRIIDVTERHVMLSDDSLGFITFEDGEAMSIEGIRRIGW